MSLDGLVIRALADELALCAGAKINKIYQPSRHDIVLQLRTQSGNRKLLLSANPTYPRIHLTDASYINPTEAPMFCMLLRKHCEGAWITSVEQPGLERVLHIQMQHRDEMGDLSIKTLIMELMGRHSNLILLDPQTGQVLDGICHVTPSISSYRIVMPGSAYTPPPEQHKQDPLLATKDAFLASLSHTDPDNPVPTLSARLVQQWSGLSPLTAKEIVARSGHAADAVLEEETNLDALWQSFHAVMADVREQRYNAVIVEQPNGKSQFSVIALTHVRGDVQTFDSVSACLEAYYGDKAERDTVKQRTVDLLRFVQNEKNKNSKKIEKLRETMDEAREADQYRIRGELLMASLHLANKGDKQVEVINYYDEEQKPIVLELDPLLTPSENAQRYFKKYTKLRNSLVVVEEQMRAAEEEIVYMETLLTQLERASLTDIDGIREELVSQGYLRDRSPKKGMKKKQPNKPLLTCYTSSEGIPIYVGKNNLQNEYVTNRLAHPNDTWLHTKDIPGSHVVIQSTAFGEPTLLEAASLAAYYSQAKQSSQVPVDYTLIRHVRKPNGAKPGFVIYERQKTLYVTADEAQIKAMPVTVK